MPYVSFKFKPEDKVYIEKRVCFGGLLDFDTLLTVKTFSRQHNNFNYYRLSDNEVYDEDSLIVYDGYDSSNYEGEYKYVYSGPYNYDVKFNIGDIAYVKLTGEKIFLKEILIAETAGNIIPIYKDNFNGLWNESDLITVAEENQLGFMKPPQNS